MNISWSEFQKVEIRIGTIIEVNDFPEAIKPAYQLKINLGQKIGIKQSSAQITALYSKKEKITFNRSGFILCCNNQNNLYFTFLVKIIIIYNHYFNL